MRSRRLAVTMTGLLVLGMAGALAAAEAADPMKDGKLDPAYQSPTLKQKPPAGATVLLPLEEGKAPPLDAWANASWKTEADGSMVRGKGNNLTKEPLADVQLHLEFLIPEGEKPGGGNSGLYIMDRYEVQILNSYGKPAGPSECGAIYRRIAPTVNASLPAGKWQTYDITFHAPRFDAQGAKTQPVRITVVLNGVKVQDNVQVDGPTGAASGKKEVAAAPLVLQDHGTDVKFRNIWFTKPKD